jgi:ribonuclease III
MVMDAPLDFFEERIGYKFRNPELLRRALTHRSRAFEGAARAGDNEQLEFLGDAILGFVISELLVQKYPSFPEGRLSKLKAWLVSASHLYAAAVKLDVGSYLYLGRGEEMSGGRAKRALLSDALEAVIAAMYLDGGLAPVREFILRHVVDDFDPAEKEAEDLVVDYKSALQELAQSMGLPAPRYAIVEEVGPEHRKMFTVEARVGGNMAQRAEGTSKKAAGQLAARLVLEYLLEHGSAHTNHEILHHPGPTP